MATDETDAKQPEGEPPTPEEHAQGEPASSEPQTTPEEEGWPRSWIVVTSVLGIIAIIVVARIAGQDWRADIPEPVGPPPGERPAGPEGKEGKEGKEPPPREAEAAALDVKDVELATGRFCLGADKKAHAFAGAMEGGPLAPEKCRIPVEGRSVRLEILRAEPGAALLLWVFPAIQDPPPLIHAFLLPSPDPSRPTWFATNQGGGMQLVIMLENPAKTPVKLKRVRLLVNR